MHFCPILLVYIQQCVGTEGTESEKRFFFRCHCIIRKIFTIIFLFLLDNNRLVGAERSSWVQLLMVTLTSDSGELLLYFQLLGGRECAGVEESWYLPGRSDRSPTFRQEILLCACRFSGHPGAGVIFLWICFFSLC